MSKRFFWLETLSSTHIGTGRGLGYIDLPLQREKVTNWPMIPGSSIKGVVADSFQAGKEGRKGNADKEKAFGKAPTDTDTFSQAGALFFNDARIFCLPIRSFKGTFAWCTSILVLQQFTRESGCTLKLPLPIPNDKVGVCNDPFLGTSLGQGANKAVLEEFDLSLQPSNETTELAKWIAERLFPGDETWQGIFKQRFAILPEELFNHFCLTGTEVITRNSIDEITGIAIDGALWTEESLPVATILTSSIECDSRDCDTNEQERLLKHFATGEKTLQMGGKASVGRGRVRCVFTAM